MSLKSYESFTPSCFFDILLYRLHKRCSLSIIRQIHPSKLKLNLEWLFKTMYCEKCMEYSIYNNIVYEYVWWTHRDWVCEWLYYPMADYCSLPKSVSSPNVDCKDQKIDKMYLHSQHFSLTIVHSWLCLFSYLLYYFNFFTLTQVIHLKNLFIWRIQRMTNMPGVLHLHVVITCISLTSTKQTRHKHPRIWYCFTLFQQQPWLTYPRENKQLDRVCPRYMTPLSRMSSEYHWG